MSKMAVVMSPYDAAALIAQFSHWRVQQSLPRSVISNALGVSEATIAVWEIGVAKPAHTLCYRIAEMMRGNGAEQLSLRQYMISNMSSYVCLIDVDDTRLIATSRGLKILWPELSHLLGAPFLPHMSAEAQALMGDQAFVCRIKQGEVVFATGASERRIAGAADSRARHRWSVSFASYGTRLVGEVWYDPEPTRLAVGVHEVLLFDDVVRS